MKKIIYVLVLFFVSVVSGQNKKILYDFDETPQTQLLNPALNLNYRYHIGVPVLSGISADFGSTGFSASDLFKKDDISFNTKLENVLNKVGKEDYGYAHAQIELLNIGYRLDRKNYISGGLYTELEVFSNVPKDFLMLATKGNASYLNKRIEFSQLNTKADALHVLHIGLARKTSDKFNWGGRFKMYFGIANVSSTNNSGTFITKQGSESIYNHFLTNANVNVNSSGFFNEKKERLPNEELRKNLYTTENLGFGFDVGMVYNFNEQTKFTASIIDVGFITYKKNNRSTNISGSYKFSGIDFKFDENNTNQYFINLENDFNEKVKSEENYQSYTVSKTAKLYTSLKHSWGRSRSEKNCYDTSYKEYYNNAVGVQLYATSQPNGLNIAFTGVYEKRLGKHLNTKFTYTIDDYSYTNLGVGLSTRLGAFQIYALVDNIFKVANFAEANNASIQAGINLNFKQK